MMMAESTPTAELKNTSPQDAKEARPDFAGILERFSLPGFDLQDFVKSRKLDIDAVTQATSKAFAGSQTILDKQSELLKTVLTELGEALRTLPQDAAKPAELIRKQQELVSDALSSTLASIKEIAETVSKSQSEIFDIASSRLRSNIEALRGLGSKQTQTP